MEIALGIRKASPLDFTAVAGYTESYIGCIPTDRAFSSGGYEPRAGRWSRVAIGSEQVVRLRSDRTAEVIEKRLVNTINEGLPRRDAGHIQTARFN